MNLSKGRIGEFSRLLGGMLVQIATARWNVDIPEKDRQDFLSLC